MLLMKYIVIWLSKRGKKICWELSTEPILKRFLTKRGLATIFSYYSSFSSSLVKWVRLNLSFFIFLFCRFLEENAWWLNLGFPLNPPIISHFQDPNFVCAFRNLLPTRRRTPPGMAVSWFVSDSACRLSKLLNNCLLIKHPQGFLDVPSSVYSMATFNFDQTVLKAIRHVATKRKVDRGYLHLLLNISIQSF